MGRISKEELVGYDRRRDIFGGGRIECVKLVKLEGIGDFLKV